VVGGTEEEAAGIIEVLTLLALLVKKVQLLTQKPIIEVLSLLAVLVQKHEC